MSRFAVIGGGAAGFFGAITLATNLPNTKVVLFEKTKIPLAKVKVSGGGRCNVTHNCFDPQKLIQYYPRGSKELLGPFTRFQPRDIIDWFESRGVPLKTEDDGRVFPISDNSQSIIDCLQNEAQKRNVELRLLSRITKIDRGFSVISTEKEHFDKILLATGSNLEGYEFARSLGHNIIPPVPSLFTFNVPESPLKELSGISLEKVSLKIKDTSLSETGPLLITHFGFSGPSVLRLSAWGARFFNEKNYEADLIINWAPEFNIQETLFDLKKTAAQHTLSMKNPFALPKNLWKKLTESFPKKLGETTDKEIKSIAEKLKNDVYHVSGKTTNKEEFVTAGGVDLKEVNFKTMESKICRGLFFAGEILNIDGITGGFNFQNAWTTSWIAGQN